MQNKIKVTILNLVSYQQKQIGTFLKRKFFGKRTGLIFKIIAHKRLVRFCSSYSKLSIWWKPEIKYETLVTFKYRQVGRFLCLTILLYSVPTYAKPDNVQVERIQVRRPSFLSKNCTNMTAYAYKIPDSSEVIGAHNLSFLTKNGTNMTACAKRKTKQFGPITCHFLHQMAPT